MRRPLVVVFAAFLFFAVDAHAGSIPTFTATQGTIFVSQGLPFGVTAITTYFFSGNGFSFGGGGTVGGPCDFCLQGGLAAFFSGDPGMTISSEGQDGLSTGGANYYPLFTSFSGGFLGSFTFGSSFNLPTGNQETFSVTLPVQFSGSLSLCPSDPNFPAGGCISGPLATINFNSKGTATINYVQQNGFWFFNSATFIMSPVPEPGTFMLMGSGITALVGMVRRRRFNSGWGKS